MTERNGPWDNFQYMYFPWLCRINLGYRKMFTWAQLFEGRLALNLGLNLTRVSFSFIQKPFLG